VTIVCSLFVRMSTDAEEEAGVKREVLEALRNAGADAVGVSNIEGLQYGSDDVRVTLTHNALQHAAKFHRAMRALGFSVHPRSVPLRLATGHAGVTETIVLRKPRRPRDLPARPTCSIVFLLVLLAAISGAFWWVVGL